MTDILQILEIATQAIIGIGTIILSMILYKTAKKHQQAEFSRSMHESWMSANIAMIQNEKMAKICDEVLFNHSNQDTNDELYHTRRYVIFLHLNIMEANYKGYKAGLITKNILDKALDDLIIPGFNIFNKQLHNGGYGNEFISYCNSRHEIYQASSSKPSDSR